ncbi:MAG: Gfo/Idh/MocA family oxidoreductase [Chloroflexi bacterium]|nr:Gfo/Idh/MocA family oxidoreductase [Chloroflexota bacterium]
MQRESYRVAIIGCGRRPQRDAEGRLRVGIAESHAKAYEAVPATKIVAAADIDPDNLRDFCARHTVPAAYTDYREMLAKEQLDIISVCTWVSLHSRIVQDCAEAQPRAILCEKPMAMTIPEADAMLQACAAHNVILAVNHQRRLSQPFHTAKELLQSGRIGDLLRIESHVPAGTLLDWGTHWIDMSFFYLDQQPVEWVVAMADRHTNRVLFGEEQEDQAIVHYQFQSGVRAYLDLGSPIIGQPANRLIGTEGVIEVGVPQGATVRVRGSGDSTWHTIPTSEGIHGLEHFIHSVDAVVRAVEHHEPVPQSGTHARQTLEVILAAYDSVVRRSKVQLPYSDTESSVRKLMSVWRRSG